MVDIARDGRFDVTTVLYAMFHGQLGGAELALLNLLDTLDRHRFRPVVLVAEEGPLVEALQRRDVSVVSEPRMRVITRWSLSPAVIATYVGTHARVVRALTRAIDAHGASLVHIFIVAALGYAGRAAHRALVPAIATVHEPLAAFTWPRRRLLVRGLNRFCDRVMVPSEATRAMAVRHGVPADRLAVVRTGIDVDRFRPDATAGRRLRQEFGLAVDAPVVGMVARFNRGKGHDVLLRAVADVVRSRPDIRCLLVGDALFPGEREWKSRVCALATALGLGDRVVFTGWRDDVPAVLAALDVFVHPPTAPDSLPTVVLEAMAAGRPVAAADIGGVPEVVEDGVSGCLVPPGDSAALAVRLSRLLGDPAGREAMGAAGRRRATCDFTRERFGRAMEAVYERACRAGGRPR